MANSQQNSPGVRPLLIIDDDEDAHFFLKRALAKLGIDAPTVSAYGGTEGVRYLDGSIAGRVPTPCLVFLDVKMPDMNGFEVLEWMKGKGLLGALTLTMFTTSDDPADVSRAMSLGAHTYMSKPAKPEALAQIVTSAIKLTRVKSPTPPSPTRGTLLIVDDSAFARRMARRLAESMGFEVTEASTGAEALASFAAKRPDTVLLDLVMGGGMYGSEVLPRMRAMNTEARIFVLTADTQDATERSVIEAGAAGIITKPLTEAKLTAALAEAK